MFHEKFLLWAIFALCLSPMTIADDDHAKDATAMKEDSFKDDVASKPHFVMFFAPWCGHCKRLAPTWQKLAEKYNDGDEIVVGKVDCTEETALCSAQDVTGYPTLKFFKSGPDSGVKHRGGRDMDALVKFIDQQMGRAPTMEEELASEPEVPLATEGLYTLSEKSFAKHIGKGRHFVKFYAPWCGHCKKLAPTWDQLAKAVDDDMKTDVSIAKLDCTQAQSVCQENGVRGYPTLAFFKDGEKVEAYSGGRSLKELKDYVHSMTDGVQAKDGEPTEDAKEHVMMADVDNFKETISSGLTFVKFFAPWCGHCKRLAPTWEELATSFADNEKVKIVKVDCTSNDNKNKELCNEQEVNGFPTLQIYLDGKKVDEYKGKRTLDELKKFVKDHMASSKDEL